MQLLDMALKAQKRLWNDYWTSEMEDANGPLQPHFSTWESWESKKTISFVHKKQKQKTHIVSHSNTGSCCSMYSWLFFKQSKCINLFLTNLPIITSRGQQIAVWIYLLLNLTYVVNGLATRFCPIAIIHETNDNTCFVNKNYVNRIFNNKI